MSDSGYTRPPAGVVNKMIEQYGPNTRIRMLESPDSGVYWFTIPPDVEKPAHRTVGVDWPIKPAEKELCSTDTTDADTFIQVK